MDAIDPQQPTRMRLPTILAHIAQVVIAIVVLGLAAYGVDYISYNVLIYSVAVVSRITFLALHKYSFQHRAPAVSVCHHG